MHTQAHTHTHIRTPFITLLLFSPQPRLPCLYILVALTKILTFISQMHVKGSQRIRFRWWMGSQRAANEIWTAEPRLRDLREGSVVRRAHNAHAGLFTQTHTHTHTHTYIHERIHRGHTCLTTHSYTYSSTQDDWYVRTDSHVHAHIMIVSRRHAGTNVLTHTHPHTHSHTGRVRQKTARLCVEVRLRFISG